MVLTGSWSSSGFPVTLTEFKSNLIKGFLTDINPKGLNSLRPKTFISKLYNCVLGKKFILLYKSCPFNFIV